MNIRILLSILLLAFAAGATANDPQDREWSFDVYVDDKRIGSHVYELIDDGVTQRVVNNAEFKVRVLLITAFQYSHTNTELWSDNCLQRFEAFTRVNSDRISVSGARTEDGFVIDAGDNRSQLPECVMSFAYWNPTFLQESSLVNPQTGEYVEVTVEPLPPEMLDVRGEALAAKPYRITADKLELKLWYSNDDDWLALESVQRGGRVIRYERS